MPRCVHSWAIIPILTAMRNEPEARRVRRLSLTPSRPRAAFLAALCARLPFLTQTPRRFERNAPWIVRTNW